MSDPLRGPCEPLPSWAKKIVSEIPKRCPHCGHCAATDHVKMKAELASANAIIDKLPKCWRLVDGVLVKDCPVVPAMWLWWLNTAGGIVSGEVWWVDRFGAWSRTLEGPILHTCNCYSTREAAAAAQAKGEVV